MMQLAISLTLANSGRRLTEGFVIVERMNQDEIVHKTHDYVKQRFSGESSGHDWWHVYRVWQLAKRIAHGEKAANSFVVQLAALVHDVPDAKLAKDVTSARRELQEFFTSVGLDDHTIRAVMSGISNTSYSSSLEGKTPQTLEAQIISDADKLDAIGAIGIARTFAYGGSKGRLMHNPERAPETYNSAAVYHANDTPSTNHFYEKLLLLKDRMYTKTARTLANHRHKTMQAFLEEFYAEWDGKR